MKKIMMIVAAVVILCLQIITPMFVVAAKNEETNGERLKRRYEEIMGENTFKDDENDTVLGPVSRFSTK